MTNTLKNIRENIAASQMARLKKEYEPLRKIDMSKHKGQVEKTTAMLSKLKMGTLIDLSKKDIPWISDIAKSLVLKDKRFAHHVESVDEAVDIKALAKQFRKNEDENRHSENYLMLAKAFGTSREVREVEAIIRRNKIQGHTDPKDNKWMFDNIGKYFHKIRQGESVEEMFSTRSLGLKGASKRSREKARAKEKEQEKSKKKEEVEENLNEKKAEYLSLQVAGLGDAKRVERWLYKNYSHVNTPYDGPYISDLNVEFENVDDADKLMADLKRAGLKFTVDVRESLIVGLNKSSAEYKAGKEAAKKGIKYDANPHAPGVKRLNWSTGHNDFRADALRKAGKPNYGARGQFEELEEGTWNIAKDMTQLKKAMRRPMRKGDKIDGGDAYSRNMDMIDFIANFIGDDELWDDLGFLKHHQDTRPAIKKAMKRLGVKEEVQLDEKKADFLRLNFADNQTVKKVDRWVYNNLGHANQGFMSMIADKNGKSIEWEDIDDADGLMTKLKRAGFSFKVDMREEG